MSAQPRPRSARADRAVGGSVWRAHLQRIGIEHRTLIHKDAQVLSLAISGWQVIPSTPAGSPAIAARVWLAAALNARGRYRAPESFGHPAELDDGGPPIDSVILMAVVQRHFLPAPEPAWDNAALAGQLGISRHDITRAQLLIDDTVVRMRRAAAPLGTGWWKHHSGMLR